MVYPGAPVFYLGNALNTCSAIEIANIFIDIFLEKKTIIDATKIQKLLYIANGYALAKTNTPLFEELFQATVFGPIIKSVYCKCLYYPKGIINFLIDFKKTNIANIKKEHIDIIYFVYENYSNINPIILSRITNVLNGPWDTTIAKNKYKYRNQTIDNELIKKYFLYLC